MTTLLFCQSVTGVSPQLPPRYDANSVSINRLVPTLF